MLAQNCLQALENRLIGILWDVENHLFNPLVQDQLHGFYLLHLDRWFLSATVEDAGKERNLVILDELFSGLSLAEVASIVPIIEKLRFQGKTIVMIEHRLKELFRIADRVMVLNYGEKIAEGSGKEVMESESVKKAYLGSET